MITASKPEAWRMPEDGNSGTIDGEANGALASHQVGLALERTMMGADRTLMAMVRTSLSLIGFGFIICEVFRQLEARHLLSGPQLAGRRVGLLMLFLGILLLAMGVVSHIRFFRNLGRRHRQLVDLGLLRGAVHYRPIPTFIGAVLLFIVGVVALIVVTAQLHS